MDQQYLEQQLIESLRDLKLSKAERSDLREIAGVIDAEKRSFVRNKAFALVRDLLQTDAENALLALKWLELVVKTLDTGADGMQVGCSVHFSPGESCRRKIIDLCHQCRQSLDICVFTISDDRLTESILNAWRRGIAVRVITDDDKTQDLGSDIDHLLGQGVEVRMDRSSYHMHHKFAVVDQRILINGSFNWTRSATDNNQENILVTQDTRLVKPYQEKFEALWDAFAFNG